MRYIKSSFIQSATCAINQTYTGEFALVYLNLKHGVDVKKHFALIPKITAHRLKNSKFRTHSVLICGDRYTTLNDTRFIAKKITVNIKNSAVNITNKCKYLLKGNQYLIFLAYTRAHNKGTRIMCGDEIPNDQHKDIITSNVLQALDKLRETFNYHRIEIRDLDVDIKEEEEDEDEDESVIDRVDLISEDDKDNADDDVNDGDEADVDDDGDIEVLVEPKMVSILTILNCQPDWESYQPDLKGGKSKQNLNEMRYELNYKYKLSESSKISFVDHTWKRYKDIPKHIVNKHQDLFDAAWNAFPDRHNCPYAGHRKMIQNKHDGTQKLGKVCDNSTWKGYKTKAALKSHITRYHKDRDVDGITSCDVDVDEL